MASSTLVTSLFAPRTGYQEDAKAIELPASTGTPASFTYAQLHGMIQTVRAQLAALSLPKGATLSSSLINSAEFVAVFLATAEEGYVLAPLTWQSDCSAAQPGVQGIGGPLLLGRHPVQVAHSTQGKP